MSKEKRAMTDQEAAHLSDRSGAYGLPPGGALTDEAAAKMSTEFQPDISEVYRDVLRRIVGKVQEGTEDTVIYESEVSEEADVSFAVNLKEARVYEVGKEKKIRCIALVSGWSSNNNYYSPQIAESLAAKLLEDRKVFADHRFDSESSRYGRKITEWCATVEDAEGKDGKTIATLALTANPQTQWLYEACKSHPNEVGISIDARAKVRSGEVSGRKGSLVEEFLRAHIDIVPNPSAGGRVLGIN